MQKSKDLLKDCFKNVNAEMANSVNPDQSSCFLIVAIYMYLKTKAFKSYNWP